MRLPCDETVRSQSATGEAPCSAKARPWILAATILGSSMAFIDSTVVNVALPALQVTFHATVVGVQWVVESYGLFLGALVLVGGSLGDLFGRRRVFVAGVAMFALASVVCGVSSSIQELIFARSVQGVGAALLVPGSLAIISKSFDERSRGQAIGTWSGFTAMTTAVGPVLGGWLVEHASWRWAFFINLPIAAAVITISFWRIPESRSPTPGHLDWWGVLVATFGLGGIVNGFIESARLGWRHPLVLGSLIVGIACLVGLRLYRNPCNFPDGPADALQEPEVQGCQSDHIVSLCRDRHFLLPVAAESDPGTGLLLNCNRGRYPPSDSADVPSFSLVRRVGRALWAETSPDRRTSRCRAGFRAVRLALH